MHHMAAKLAFSKLRRAEALSSAASEHARCVEADLEATRNRLRQAEANAADTSSKLRMTEVGTRTKPSGSWGRSHRAEADVAMLMERVRLAELEAQTARDEAHAARSEAETARARADIASTGVRELRDSIESPLTARGRLASSTQSWQMATSPGTSRSSVSDSWGDYDSSPATVDPTKPLCHLAPGVVPPISIPRDDLSGHIKGRIKSFVTPP